MRLTSIADSVREGQKRVRATTVSLNELVTKPADLSKQFGQYVKNLDSLESQAASVRKAADKMAKEVDTYIKKWSEELAQIKNEDIRARSETRQQQVNDGLKRIQSNYQALAEAFKPFMADMQDIETALQTDLTRGGVESIRDIAAKTQEEAKVVLSRADDIAADFEALGRALSPADSGSH